MEISLDARRRCPGGADRKSTRLNSSHSQISYAVFCLKKKKQYSDHIGRPQVLTPVKIKTSKTPCDSLQNVQFPAPCCASVIPFYSIFERQSLSPSSIA